MPPIPDLLLQLLLVVLVGGIVGAEREFRSKSAGFRTMILICLGSYLFTIFSIHIGVPENRDRIASYIVAGVGFMGGGVIFKSDNRINGVTTAATIWSVAALGMGIADKAYAVVGLSTAVLMIALLLFPRLERLIDKVNQTHNYRIVSGYKEDLLNEYETLLEQCGLRFKRTKRTKQGENIIGTWLVSGSEKAHNRFTKAILHHASVKEFEF